MRLMYKHMAFLAVVLSLLSLNVGAIYLFPELEGRDSIALMVNIVTLIGSKELIYK